MALGLKTVLVCRLWLKDFHLHRKMITIFWNGSIGMLIVASHIDAQHPAIIDVFDETTHAIGKTLCIDPAGSGTASFGEN
jgi:hypothetical protein